MPTEHDWEDEEPITEEDAVKRMLKRVNKLNGPGVIGDLWKMHQHCHKEVEENGNMDHLPMDYVRYDGPEKEVAGELFYICRDCLSKYVTENPEVVLKDKIVILRGKLSKTCQEVLRQKAEEHYKEEMAKKEEEQKKIDTTMSSDAPCPICGKPFKDHTPDDAQSCMKSYTETHPQDADGTANAP